MEAVKKIFSGILSKLGALGVGGGKGSTIARPMKFPYTLTAKIVQFPWMFYIKNNWIWKYYFPAVLVSIPFFYKIQCLANSPANVKKWEEQKHKED